MERADPAAVVLTPSGTSLRLDDPSSRQGSQAALSDLFDRHRLTPVQRRIAAYISSHLGDAAFLSSVDLADRVGVSQPSVTRFAVALDFSGYPALLDAIRGILLSSASADTPPANKMQRAITHSIDALTTLRGWQSDQTIVSEAADALYSSRPLPVFGHRSARALAEHFSYFAQRIHPAVWPVTRAGSEGKERLLDSRLAGASAMLAVVLPRYPTESREMLRYAKEIGLLVVLITDSPLAAPTGLADLVLAAPVTSDLIFDGHVAVLQQLVILLEAMSDVAAPDTERRLDHYESLARGNAVFTDDFTAS